MRKLSLMLSLLLITTAAARAEECDCPPVEYDELLNMPVSELQAKIDRYARSKEMYSHGGSTYCYYTCATELEHLGDVKVQKEMDQVKDRAARRARQQDNVLQTRPLTR